MLMNDVLHFVDMKQSKIWYTVGQYLSGVMWACRNTPHESTGEKPSFLLFGVDCQTPTEAALLPPAKLEDYWEEVIQSLSSA